MKRFLALVLALVIVLSFAPAAFAVGSPVAPVDNGKKAAALPVVVSGTAKLTPVDKVADLPEDAQKEMKAAQESIKDAVPDGMVAMQEVYVDTGSTEPTEMTIEIEGVTDASDVAFKMFKDGKWIDVEFVLNADGTITLKLPSSGPLMICTKK